MIMRSIDMLYICYTRKYSIFFVTFLILDLVLAWLEEYECVPAVTCREQMQPFVTGCHSLSVVTPLLARLV